MLSMKGGGFEELTLENVFELFYTSIVSAINSYNKSVAPGKKPSYAGIFYGSPLGRAVNSLNSGPYTNNFYTLDL